MQPHSPTKDRVRNHSLWGSYKVLPARTRLYISMGVCTLGVAGLFVSDYLEKTLPPTPRGTAKSPST
ncbi:hypothetical protein F5J12DRAFT_817967 [Pisolithus orientalis]|uniref:uncharacterized protein n=1 Tax=Pisolithus orientalis TaxID=936130 RepID=UPI0022254B83|nr:uncharacterized protein F5J12DRAFT_817967 [Pisolithus orientalis]KAI6012419.1 hypothetical protein F5J12DRAFT_817967 [Pisolithus orientalis]